MHSFSRSFHIPYCQLSEMTNDTFRGWLNTPQTFRVAEPTVAQHSWHSKIERHWGAPGCSPFHSRAVPAESNTRARRAQGFVWGFSPLTMVWPWSERVLSLQEPPGTLHRVHWWHKAPFISCSHSPPPHQSPEPDQLCLKHPEVPGKVCQTHVLKHSSTPSLTPFLFRQLPSKWSQVWLWQVTPAPALPLKGHPSPRQAASDSRGLWDLHLHCSCNPPHVTDGGAGESGRCSSEPQVEVAAAEGLCYTQGQRLLSKSLSCLAFIPHTWKKNVSSSWKQASAALEKQKKQRLGILYL